MKFYAIHESQIEKFMSMFRSCGVECSDDDVKQFISARKWWPGVEGDLFENMQDGVRMIACTNTNGDSALIALFDRNHIAKGDFAPIAERMKDGDRAAWIHWPDDGLGRGWMSLVRQLVTRRNTALRRIIVECLDKAQGV